MNRSCALLSNGTAAISTLANTTEPAVELVAAACLVFRGTGRIGEGLEYLDKALAVARTGSILEGNLIEERGHLLRAGARLPSALRAYEEALGIWVRQPRPDREAVCHLRIGDVLRLMGSYDEAAEHYQLGFRLHEELGENPLARGDALECLADVARVTGDWDRAITLYTDAQQTFRSVPDGLVGLTNTAHSLGEPGWRCPTSTVPGSTTTRPCGSASGSVTGRGRPMPS
ncbi:MAG: tetratricopeptide repeat protein [Pseudonocardiaceae bacterium]